MLADGHTDVPAGKIATVVTHLEMTERPAPRPEIAGDFTLVRHPEPDCAWFRELYRRVGEDWLWFSRLRMSDAELAAIIHSPKVEVYALRSQGRDEGLLELDFSKLGQCELSFFGVTRKLIGSGAGRWLMNRALERAWAPGVGRIWLHTCTLDHPSAIAFYQRSGFRPYRLQIEVADDPRLVGELSLSAAPHVPVIDPDDA